MWTQDFKGFYPTYPLLFHFMLLTSVLSRNYLQTNKQTNQEQKKNIGKGHDYILPLF